MTRSLDWIRSCVARPGDAVRWACVLEATAPKAGNVYPGKPFHNLAYHDFVLAAEIAADRLDDPGQPVSQRMLNAVIDSVSKCQSNVNLGIILLLGPLVAADEWMSRHGIETRSAETWKCGCNEVIGQFGPQDGKTVFHAIAAALAGGLGEVPEMDVHDHHDQVDLVQAMGMIADRDRVALQYVNRFSDLIDQVVPVVNAAIERQGDLLVGISHAHGRLLQEAPDSLIGRKNGLEVAKQVQRRAQKMDLDDPISYRRFDESLRTHSHKLNPGTTADLIAASLYVLLRSADVAAGELGKTELNKH